MTSRTTGNADRLAGEYGALLGVLSDLRAELALADVVVPS